MNRITLKHSDEIALLQVLSAALAGQPISQGRQVALRLRNRIFGRQAVRARTPHLRVSEAAANIPARGPHLADG